MSLDFKITGGTGAINGQYVDYDEFEGTLAANATNYIWVEDPDGNGYGQVQVGTSGFPADVLELWEVDTDSSGITDRRDQRSNLIAIRGAAQGDVNLFDEFAVKDSQFSYALSWPVGTEQISIDDTGFTASVDGDRAGSFTTTFSVDDTGFSYNLA